MLTRGGDSMKRDFQRGAVSVFLAIILVPCIVVSSIFVDLSRVKLAKSVAVSSSDLALNSLMSYYDKDLSQFYGMMASCQNIDDFYEESAKYFLDALHSQGLEQDDIDSIVEMYSVVVGDDTVYDLLQLDVQTDTNSIISAVDGASLGESSLLIKDQIVDFMKYRGPIEITSGVIDHLSKSGISESIKEASKNEELVEDKQAYGEAANELLEASYKSYVYLKKYQDEKPYSFDELQNICDQMKKYREIYREINAAIMTNFINTSGLGVFNRPTYGIDTYASTYSKTNDKVYSRKETVDGDTVYYVDGNDIKNQDSTKGIIPEMQKKINAFQTAKDNLVSATNSWRDMSTGTGSDQANEVQWWVRVNGAINNGGNSHIEKYKTAAKNMLDAYSKMKAMLECEDGKDVPANWRQDCESLKAQVEGLQSRYLTANVTDNSDGYLKLVKKLETVSKNNIGKILSSSYKLSNGKTIGATVGEISNQLTAYKAKLEKLIDLLDIVIDGDLLKGVKKLDKLKELLKKRNNAFEAWEGTAESVGTQMGEDDLNGDIKDARDAYGEINDASVNELKSRLVNVRTQLQQTLDAINAMKYGSKKVAEISDYSKVYNSVKNKVSSNEIKLKNGELKSNAETIFSKLFSPYSDNTSSAVAVVSHKGDTKYDPNLENSKPALYAYWCEEFKNVNEEELKKEKDKVDGGKKEAEKKKKELDDKDWTKGTDVSKTNIYKNSAYASSEFPSGLDKQSPYKLGSSVLSSISNVVDAITGDGVENIVTSLYSAEYVMDMFSYATYANEGKYHLLEADIEAGAKSGSIKESDSPFTDYAEQWKSEELTFTANKTLTNKRISSANNAAYGAEAEYILYGNTNKKNLQSAYSDIYAIRYPLNLVSGFANFWNGSDTTSRTIRTTADLIATATQGIVPAILTKSVLIALLTVFETGRDLERLQKGFPVEAYKVEVDDWRMTLNGWTPTDSKDEKDNTQGLFYSDYIYLFLYLGFESKSASEMYYRIGDLIQANMRKVSGETSYQLKNAKTYFKLESEIRVKPLMITLPYSLPYSNNPKDKIDWCTFKLSEIRGYS